MKTEAQQKAEAGISHLLEYIGEDVTREGLLDTPKRVAKAMLEMTSGYQQDPKEILTTRFTESSDQMVVLKDIKFVSLCEHHMLPFTGIAHVAYLPNGVVVGISKLARLVHCFARRLQVQERMTNQIADALMEHLLPKGCGVVIEAHHECMSCRGVKQENSKMITSALRGTFYEDVNCRSEFFSLVK